MSFLEDIVAHKRNEIAAAKALAGQRVSDHTPRDFAGALRTPGLSFIAEIKRRSPSKGVLKAGIDAARLARSYERGGASAVSCLTDRQYFGAEADDLKCVSSAVAVPVLRKDFVIDEWQIRESLCLGADAILLIVRLLESPQLSDYLTLCREMSLGALVEVHDEVELETAVAAGAGIIGINNRNLASFAVSLTTSLRLRPLIPPGVIAVAESGISTRADVVALEQAGFDAVLVGESLVRASDPEALLAELRGVQ
jgi:indole-3-glycerol phosphate synthase